MTLDHTIVPVGDKEQSAAFYRMIFGFATDPPIGPFTVLRVNDSLTLDLAELAGFGAQHYAFKVSDAEFDTVFERVRSAGIPYFADPHHEVAGQCNTRRGGRGFYFDDPDGHNLEVLTR